MPSSLVSAARRPTDLAFSAPLCRLEAIGSKVKLIFSQAEATISGCMACPVILARPALTTCCPSAG
jgi:hypothetical protein